MHHLFLLFLFLLVPLAPLHSAQEPRDAIAYLRADAEQGDAAAQYNLGVLYSNGNGAAQDYIKTHNYSSYIMAAVAVEQGHILTRPYAVGYHGPTHEGLRFLNSNGQVNSNGQGVAQDYVQARNWFLKAAEQGYEAAQYGLGVLYHNGQGVPQDYSMAYVWYDIAAAQGQAKAEGNRDAVAARLDAASLAEAQKLSKEFFKRYVEPFQ